MAKAWPWVGRRRELASARRALAPGRALVVTGPEASGRTRTARELAADHPDPRWVSACGAGRPLPFGALARWVRPGSPPTPDAVADALLDGAGILVVDDADLLDDASVSAVAEAMATARVPVLLTVGATRPAAPLDDLLNAPDVTTITLGDLDRTETGELIAAAVGGPVDPGTVGRLWLATRGTPGYLRAMISQALSTGALARRFGIWTLDDEPEIPGELRDRIGARLRAAGPGATEVVDALVEAGDLSVETLEMLTDADAVTAALDAALIVVDDPAPGSGPVAAVAHPMITAARRTSAGIAHRRRLRDTLVAALRDVDLSRRTLSVELGLASLAVEEPGFADRDHVLVRGADAAVRTLDFPLAVRYCREVGPGPFRTAALLTEGYISAQIGHGDDSEAALLAAARSADEPVIVEVATMLRVYNQVTGRGDLRRAREIVDESAASGALSASSGRAALGFVLAADGEATQACRVLEPLSTAGDLTELARMFFTMGAVIAGGDTGRTGLVDDAMAIGDQQADRWRMAPHQRVALGCLEIQARHLCGDIGGAARALDEMVRRIPGLPGPGTHWLTGLAGLTALAECRMADAVAHLRTALDGLDRAGQPEFVRYPFWLACAEAAAQGGDTGTADAMLAQLDQARGETYEFFRPRVGVIRAWREAGLGLLESAVALAGDAAGLARSRGQLAQEAYCLETVVRLGDPAPADRLAALADELPQCPRAALLAAHARALGAGDPEALTTAAAASRAARLVGAATDADAQATLLLRQRGRQGAALSALQRASATTTTHGIRTVAVQAASSADGLTPRQREIVRLVEAGLSNQQIADITGLSVRTVEGHRYRAARTACRVRT
ncbi:MAG: helix-turn-helix transcriptional regulator [Gordonia sp. (in: high G+C Gram-positive bacteria)]|uniref:helix-turn-helix transcriptional regulator n=1 Tax=Gordonia sp. (in: high G+C Gram-positive bacteria) TaxID=84139 RepID=UPI0039E3C64D